MGRLPVLGALALVVVPAAGSLAWAGHGAGSVGSMNPWLEAVLWGAAGLAAAMTITLLVMLFTRTAKDPEKGKGHRQ